MQKIDNISIKNFKSIRDAQISDCRRVNVFIGYPNVGKSNILEAIGLFSIANLEIDVRKTLRIDNLNSIFFNGDIQNASEIILNQRNRMLVKLKGKELQFVQEFDREKYGFDLIDKSKFSLDRKDPIDFFNFFIDDKLNSRGYEGNNFLREDESVNPIYFYQFKDIEKLYTDSGSRLDNPFGKNLFTVIESNNEIRKDVTELFKQYNLKFSFDKSSREFKILKNVGDDIFLISYAMIADTLRRLIFYKAAIKSNEDSILLFEEPEAHMFPPYIGKLTTDINLDYNNNQFFISTHSPFVLNDFMEDLEPKDLAIFAVGYKNETGETIIRRINDSEITEIYQFGIDLFFNIENFLKDAV